MTKLRRAFWTLLLGVVLSLPLILGGFSAAPASPVATHLAPNGWCTVQQGPAGECM